MEAPLPDTVEGAVRWLLGGVLIFAFGFESVVMLWEGKFVLSACSLVIATALTLLLVYWAYLPTIVLVAAFILSLVSIPLVFYGIFKFVRGRKIPKPMLFITATFLLVVALIAAIAGGALFYVVKTTGSVSAEPKTVIVHDPPTAEQIATAAGEALRTVTAQRDLLKQDNDLLRKIVPQPAPPPPPPPRTLPEDEKARLRPIVTQLGAIFDSSGGAAWQLIAKLRTDIDNDFDNGPFEEPAALMTRVREAQQTMETFKNQIFNDFLPSHNFDKPELSALVGDDKAINAFIQSTAGFFGGLNTVKVLMEKSTDKAFTLSYGMSLLIEKYRIFFGAAEDLKKWFDGCDKRLQQEKQKLQ